MLKVINHEPKSLRWWYEQYLDGRIDLSPTYQRKGEIWSKWKKGHLIDSVLNDFDIPKFYVANFYLYGSENLNEKKQGFAIIDGKQRFGAIFSFFNNEISLNPTFIFDDDTTLKLGGLKYSDLKSRFPFLALKLDNFVPTVMDVVTDEKGKIEELFLRLNMGEHTTGAEKRNAMGGPVPVIVRELSEHPFFLQKIKFSTTRMQEYNLATKLLMFEFLQGFGDTKAKNLQEFTETADKWSQAREEKDQIDLGLYGEARERVFEVLERMALEFEKEDPLLSKQGEIPIYYWAARMHPEHCNMLRDFVLSFSQSVLENMREQRDNPDSGDRELSSYYTLSRTTNDSQSYERRYRIFEKRFLAFCKPVGRSIRKPVRL